MCNLLKMYKHRSPGVLSSTYVSMCFRYHVFKANYCFTDLVSKLLTTKGLRPCPYSTWSQSVSECSHVDSGGATPSCGSDGEYMSRGKCTKGYGTVFVKPECSHVNSGEQRHLVSLMVSIYPGVYVRKAME